MNTHDIELPPLPEAVIVSYQTDSTMRRMELRTYSGKDMRDYARAAVEADRKRRGISNECEPVAWLYEDELPDNYPYDTMFPYSKVDGVRMFPVYAPQPAEPEKPHLRVSYDDKFDCLHVVCDSNEPIDAEEDDKGILYRRAIADGRLVGITIMNFMGPHAESRYGGGTP